MNRTCVLRLSADTCLHSGQVRLVLRGGTASEMAAVPCQLVVQLPAALEPALIQDGLVQTGLGP